MKYEITRRRFGTVVGGALVSFACGSERALRGFGGAADANDGRLSARARADVSTTAGSHTLGLERGRDAILQVPAKAAATPLPLLVLLHGAGGSGEGVLRRVGAAADEAGVVVLSPDSRGSTWDAIRDGFGPDVTFLNRALERVFDTVSVDPARIAVGGFSDGASYALSLGLINGDLFTGVVAFSPGFIVNGTSHGKPRFFISHGTSDPILPIDQTSRMIVPALKRRGYDVTFREFDGGHQVPPDIAKDAMRWAATRDSSARDAAGAALLPRTTGTADR
jgi:phospholipase/carboxylesterase